MNEPNESNGPAYLLKSVINFKHFALMTSFRKLLFGIITGQIVDLDSISALTQNFSSIPDLQK